LRCNVENSEATRLQKSVPRSAVPSESDAAAGRSQPRRCRAHTPHVRLWSPDSGLGFQVNVLKMFSVVPCSVGSGWCRVKLAERVVSRGAVQEVGWHARVQPDRVCEILPNHPVSTPGQEWKFQTQRFAAKSVSWYKWDIIRRAKGSNSQDFWRVSRVKLTLHAAGVVKRKCDSRPGVD